jgi:superoxide reductase
MTKRLEVYKCTVCGNIVEVLHEGVGQLVCCDQPMELQIVKTEEVGMEKHLPVIERKDGKIIVTVGSVHHPMEEKHYIEWIELIADGKVYRQFLSPGEKPQAVFEITADKVAAREYCNVHAHWGTA